MVVVVVVVAVVVVVVIVVVVVVVRDACYVDVGQNTARDCGKTALCKNYA